jgi:beta-galactosidase GanA
MITQLRAHTTGQILRSSGLLGGILALATMATGAAAGPVEDLPGYWTGTGAVTMASGTTEQLKCVVTYKVSGSSLKQNLRCANAAYTINGLADLEVRGDQVTGAWEEQTYAAKGVVTGKVVEGGFNLNIEGATFKAAMKVSGTNCKQSLAITPTGLDVTKIALNLGKC